MYCKIKNIECKYAGELVIQGAPELNGDNEEHVYTMWVLGSSPNWFT